MRLALDQARDAAARDEAPIGCVIAHDGVVIATAGNRRERDRDPLAHAEVLAIREAARVLGRWRLTGCTMYVTLEPCTMCAGAIVLARPDRVVYGADDPKAGAVRSLYRVLEDERLNHAPIVERGVLAEECGAILSDFFRAKRERTKASDDPSKLNHDL
ncbi:MAG: nucleoside deaminase [Deltaproteobacteria bacterium]|nr:nucleoside deaminase [Deltaproteobacteria bacterium]